MKSQKEKIQDKLNCLHIEKNKTTASLNKIEKKEAEELRPIQKKEKEIEKKYAPSFKQGRDKIELIENNIARLESQFNMILIQETLESMDVSLDWFKSWTGKIGINQYNYDKIDQKSDTQNGLKVFVINNYRWNKYFAFKSKKLVAYQHTRKSEHAGDRADYYSWFGRTKLLPSTSGSLKFKEFYAFISTEKNFKEIPQDKFNMWFMARDSCYGCDHDIKEEFKEMMKL